MSSNALKYKSDFCETAVKVLAGGESLAAVCDELDISRTTLYAWREDHPEFAEAIKKGLQKAQRDWESIGRAGAKGEIDKFGASTWIFTMKNRFREDYSDDKEQKSTNDSIVEQLLLGKKQQD